MNLSSLNLQDPAPPILLIEAIEKIAQSCNKKNNHFSLISHFFSYLTESKIDEHSFYRMEFWKKLLNENRIEQAWIILAPSAENYMIEKYHLKFSQFGRLLKSKRIEDSHGVLLLRVSGWIIAEWSHIGKCRLWRQTNPKAPEFFKDKYTKNELTDLADKVQQHYFSKKGLWQKDLNLILK